MTTTSSTGKTTTTMTTATATASRPAPIDEGDLVTQVSQGETAAFAELFSTNVQAATAFARSLTRCAADADDLVAEAFTRILVTIADGSAPVERFRPYLFGIIKNLARTGHRTEARVEVRDEFDHADRHGPGRPGDDDPADTVVSMADQAAVVEAMRTLPEAWRNVLWEVEVNGSRPRELAATDPRSAHCISALAHRAREGLRDAYLASAVAGPGLGCEGISERLGAYVRDTTGARERARIASHVHLCHRCHRAAECIAGLADEYAIRPERTALPLAG